SEQGLGDVSGRAGVGRSQLIVAGLQPAQAQTADRDGLGAADRFGGEAGGAANEADIVAGQRAAQGAGGNRGRGRAIIDLVVGADQSGHGSGSDVGGGASGGIGRVITRIDAADRDATDADGLGRADILVGETGAGVAGGQAVAAYTIIRESDR